MKKKCICCGVEHEFLMYQQQYCKACRKYTRELREKTRRALISVGIKCEQLEKAYKENDELRKILKLDKRKAGRPVNLQLKKSLEDVKMGKIKKIEVSDGE